jgi:hypothetical protein
MTEHDVIKGLARMAAERALSRMELHAGVWGTAVYHFRAYEGQDDHDRLWVTYLEEGDWTYALHIPGDSRAELTREHAIKLIAHNKELRAAE